MRKKNVALALSALAVVAMVLPSCGKPASDSSEDSSSYVAPVIVYTDLTEEAKQYEPVSATDAEILSLANSGSDVTYENIASVPSLLKTKMQSAIESAYLSEEEVKDLADVVKQYQAIASVTTYAEAKTEAVTFLDYLFAFIKKVDGEKVGYLLSFVIRSSDKTQTEDSLGLNGFAIETLADLAGAKKAFAGNDAVLAALSSYDPFFDDSIDYLSAADQYAIPLKDAVLLGRFAKKMAEAVSGAFASRELALFPVHLRYGSDPSRPFSSDLKADWDAFMKDPIDYANRLGEALTGIHFTDATYSRFQEALNNYLYFSVSKDYRLTSLGKVVNTTLGSKFRASFDSTKRNLISPSAIKAVYSFLGYGLRDLTKAAYDGLSGVSGSSQSDVEVFLDSVMADLGLIQMKALRTLLSNLGFSADAIASEFEGKTTEEMLNVIRNHINSSYAISLEEVARVHLSTSFVPKDAVITVEDFILSGNNQSDFAVMSVTAHTDVLGYQTGTLALVNRNTGYTYACVFSYAVVNTLSGMASNSTFYFVSPDSSVYADGAGASRTLHVKKGTSLADVKAAATNLDLYFYNSKGVCDSEKAFGSALDLIMDTSAVNGATYAAFVDTMNSEKAYGFINAVVFE